MSSIDSARDDPWQEAICTNFQLPHRDHPEDGHTDCIYTIHLRGKWLVSGGKDKTVRVWDLETYRLRGSPLAGHSESVLCLQFDESEDEDVMISGSVDASVIVWQFSTGRMLKRITSAHESSVLDLRFDRRYLFTCSKDKTVKIWSRREMTPLSEEYPRIQNGPETSVPAYVIDVTSTPLSFIEAGLASGSIETLKPYTHIATLKGSAAAVNAVDNHGDILVSGSGDRTIRIWSIITGQCLSVLRSHQKGIACLQFDGEHIITGSSDNSIRIHDSLTGAEVTVLNGHSNLVRAIQVDFDSVLATFKNEADRGLDNPSTSTTATSTENREDGPTWDRVVSGSYDESIIIWKRNANGEWFAEHTLRLKDAQRALDAQSNNAMAALSIEDRLSVGDQTPPQEPTLRVFKVAFDARRIMCASQDLRIYGWEFTPRRA